MLAILSSFLSGWSAGDSPGRLDEPFAKLELEQGTMAVALDWRWCWLWWTTPPLFEQLSVLWVTG
jgi:hypothetical protein